MKKKAVIIGHHATDKGAWSKYLNKSEWDFFSLMTRDLEEKVGKVFFHNPRIPGYRERMQDTAKIIDIYNPDLIFALHFNAFNGLANGCEAFYFHTNETGKSYAQNFCREINLKMAINNRGAKPMKDIDQRGYYEVYYPKATTLLLEPFFGDNASDCDRFDSRQFIQILSEL